MTFSKVIELILELHGRWLWDATTDHHRPHRLTAYRVDRGRVIVVHDYGEDGWEIYVPASDRNDVESTLAGAGLSQDEFAHLRVDLLRRDADELIERLGVHDDAELAVALRHQLEDKLSQFRGQS